MKQAHSTDEAPSAAAFLSQAITAGGLVFVSGQIHSTPDGKLIDGSTKEKLDQIMKNISAILKSADATINDVAKVTIYVTDMEQMPEINEAYPAYFQERYPAREAVCVKQLPLGATIEISVIAAKE